MGEATAHGAKRRHARGVLFDALSLLPMGGEKNLEGMGEAAVMPQVYNQKKKKRGVRF